MALYITEFSGYASGRPFSQWPNEPALNTQVLSSATTSTASLSANTRLVRLYASANAWVLFTGSSVSTSVATSTNAQQIVAGTAPEFRNVVPASRLTCLST